MTTHEVSTEINELQKAWQVINMREFKSDNDKSNATYLREIGTHNLMDR